MKILVLHTLPPLVPAADRMVDEFDLSAGARNLAEVLPEAVVVGVRGDLREVVALLDLHRPDVVFNVCEAPLGRPDLEPHIAALFEWLGIRFTGSGSGTLSLCRRKDRTNAVLASAGIPVPSAGVFPCIVKPADEDGSAGIHADSICEDAEMLAVARSRVAGPVVIQEFVPGREFVVSLWGWHEPDFFSIGETCFQNELRLITYAAKWDPASPDFADSPLDYNTVIDPELRESVLAAARGAWRAVDARGYLRTDIRLDSRGMPYVLDVNPNPELGPGVGICRAVQEAGWTWKHFVQKQVEWA